MGEDMPYSLFDVVHPFAVVGHTGSKTRLLLSWYQDARRRAAQTQGVRLGILLASNFDSRKLDAGNCGESGQQPDHDPLVFSRFELDANRPRETPGVGVRVVPCHDREAPHDVPCDPTFAE